MRTTGYARHHGGERTEPRARRGRKASTDTNDRQVLAQAAFDKVAPKTKAGEDPTNRALRSPPATEQLVESARTRPRGPRYRDGACRGPSSRAHASRAARRGADARRSPRRWRPSPRPSDEDGPPGSSSERRTGFVPRISFTFTFFESRCVCVYLARVLDLSYPGGCPEDVHEQCTRSPSAGYGAYAL